MKHLALSRAGQQSFASNRPSKEDGGVLRSAWRKLLIMGVALALAGCAAVVKVGPGETVVGNRIMVNIDSAWNQVNLPGSSSSATLWTMEGITIDNLELYPGLKDGDLLAQNSPNAKNARPLAFKASMRPDEIVALYQGLYSRDGSVFTLDKLEPADFAGGKGFRFQFTVVRKVDDVKLSGMAWAAVRDNQLFAMTYTAPRLGFFPRYQARVEQIAKTVRVKKA